MGRVSLKRGPLNIGKIMSFEKRITFETEQAIAFGSIGAAFAAIGNPFTNALRQMVISNLTDQELTFSFDGTNDHITLGIDSKIVISSNDFSSSDVIPEFVQGTQVFVKQQILPPTTGTAVVSGLFLN